MLMGGKMTELGYKINRPAPDDWSCTLRLLVENYAINNRTWTFGGRESWPL